MTKYAGALPYRKEREIDHCDVNGICRLITLNETFQSVRVWTQIRAVEKKGTRTRAKDGVNADFINKEQNHHMTPEIITVNKCYILCILY